jgi:CBS domain-containing protein
MTAARIITEKGREVFIVSPDASLVDAARTRTEHKVGAAVVVNGGHEPVGVFSERDLARAVAAEGAAALSETVSTVMSTRLVTATPSATIDELMGQMTDRRVRHVLIVEEGALAGVVSIGDVVKRKIATAEAEAESLKAYIEGV